MTEGSAERAGSSGAVRELSWTLLRADALAADSDTPDGAENMARDDTLARSLGPDEGVVRFYRWRRPTLSFGRNEPARTLYLSDAELRAAGLDVVRRPTGGRAVLHDHELTYSVVAPIDAFASLREAYRAINAALVTGLRKIGAPVEQVVEGGVLPVDAGPCFQAPAVGEVVLGGRKLVGSAQVRIGRTLLQHGSILLRDDQSGIEVLRRPDARPHVDAEAAEPPATLAELPGSPPSIPDLVDALAGGFRTALGGDWRTDPGNGSFPLDLLHIRRRHYASPDWTWRR